MGPVSAVNVGSAGAGASLRPVSGNATSASAVSGTAGNVDALSAGQAGLTEALRRVFTEVSNLLQSIGGGLENDAMLRNLIALLIILALLERMGTGSQGVRGNGLLEGGGGNSQYIGVFTSSTTISIQQSSTMVFMAEGMNAFGAGAGAGADGGAGGEDIGGRMDFSV